MPAVSVEGYDVEVETRPGEPILGALCRRGYTYKFGCRRGGCGVCKVHLVSGEVAYPKTVAETVLPDSDRDGGVCLSCRAVPVTDVVIRLDAEDQLRRVGILPFLSGIKSAPGQ
ncbi:2Fe-2S iron-sulfur cluster-binding protein [Mycobacterium sp. NBC_00419]|uniref:2Fe-2S iron-sulfur cluster-binding protein n=1 Tax=Mycobacterium sp. NBC_00419 TaxID=2975989 RepID=UPI002E1D2285